MKEKLKKENNKEKLAKTKEVTSLEDVSTDATASDEVFSESLETNPGYRLRLRSRKIVFSVGEGEADEDYNKREEKETDDADEEDLNEFNACDLYPIC